MRHRAGAEGREYKTHRRCAAHRAQGTEKKTAAAGRKKIDGSRWRTTAANWFSGKEAKRLRELRKLFRDKEREKLGGAGQNDTLILLR